jgi:hypothetical protein
MTVNPWGPRRSHVDLSIVEKMRRGQKARRRKPRDISKEALH